MAKIWRRRGRGVSPPVPCRDLLRLLPELHGVPRVHRHSVGRRLAGNFHVEVRPTQGRHLFEHRLDETPERLAGRIELGDPELDLVHGSLVLVVDVSGDPRLAVSIRFGGEVDPEELIGEGPLRLILRAGRLETYALHRYAQ